MFDPSLPEFASVVAFVEFCFDNDRVSFSHEDVAELHFRTGQPVQSLVAEISDYGLTLAERPIPRHVRGFTTSSNDRWFGPGSSPCHGGAAHNMVMSAKYGISPFGER
jgi:hypothetical protein